MRENIRVYISLIVYDYDYSSRYRRIKHICHDVKQAKHLIDQLFILKGTGITGGGHSRGLDRNHQIYGFIDTIEGIFEEITRKIV